LAHGEEAGLAHGAEAEAETIGREATDAEAIGAEAREPEATEPEAREPEAEAEPEAEPEALIFLLNKLLLKNYSIN
jgi:hypothetical protein